MQTLPYVVVTNPHVSLVYELYYKAFESLRRVREIRTLEDNERFCQEISRTLQEHLSVIPKLAMGVLECRDLIKAEDMDTFMNTILRSVSSVAYSIATTRTDNSSAYPGESSPSSIWP
jgi:pyruvate dehydrogenase kinase 2/3/4